MTDEVLIDKKVMLVIYDAIFPFAIAFNATQQVDEFKTAIEKSTGLAHFSATIKQNIAQAKVSYNDWRNLANALSAITPYLDGSYLEVK